MKKFAMSLAALGLLAAPALASETFYGTAAKYGNSTPATVHSEVEQSAAATVRPTSAQGKSFNFSGRLPVAEDFERSNRR